ncbi:hypothetical protein [Streptobacillus moniliformis]|nr:hypothetical protein [Streptobacillus moniliformis]
MELHNRNACRKKYLGEKMLRITNIKVDIIHNEEDIRKEMK